MVVQGVMRWHGEAVGARAQSFGLREHFGDGANVVQYVGGNPVIRLDNLGLEFAMDMQFATSEGVGMQAIQNGSYVAYVGVASTPGYTAFTAGAGSLGAMPGLLGGGTFAGANLSLAAKIVVALGGGAIIGHQMFAAMGGGQNGDSFSLLPGFSAQWRKHDSSMAQTLQMKAKNSRDRVDQGIWDADSQDVARLLVASGQIQPGRDFTGRLPLPPGLARVFEGGTGSARPASGMFVRWQHDRILNLYPVR
jgi:hypothetical protein